jgi:hypothetical protein
MLAGEALAAIRGGNGAGDARDRVGLARFFAETIAVQSSGLETSVTEGAAAVTGAPLPAA